MFKEEIRTSEVYPIEVKGELPNGIIPPDDEEQAFYLSKNAQILICGKYLTLSILQLRGGIYKVNSQSFHSKTLNELVSKKGITLKSSSPILGDVLICPELFKLIVYYYGSLNRKNGFKNRENISSLWQEIVCSDSPNHYLKKILNIEVPENSFVDSTLSDIAKGIASLQEGTVRSSVLMQQISEILSCLKTNTPVQGTLVGATMDSSLINPKMEVKAIQEHYVKIFVNPNKLNPYEEFYKTLYARFCYLASEKSINSFIEKRLGKDWKTNDENGKESTKLSALIDRIGIIEIEERSYNVGDVLVALAKSVLALQVEINKNN